MKSKKILKKLVGLCFEVSGIDNLDAFFDYSPHVYAINIYINVNADYKSNEINTRLYDKTVYLPESLNYSEKSVNDCIEFLQAVIYQNEQNLDSVSTEAT